MSEHYMRGYPVIRLSDGRWIFADSRETAPGDRPCARCGECPVSAVLPDPRTGGDPPWIESSGLDACLAPVVVALCQGGRLTRTACCGHGTGEGWISFRDGSVLKLAKLK